MSNYRIPRGPRAISRLALLAAAALAALAAAPLAAAPLQGPAVAAVDSSGARVALKAPAARVVSLSPAATETVYAAGAGAALVGDTTYCDYPAEAAKVEKVGGFAASTISVERIVALRPDLVITAGAMHASVAAALSRLSIPVFAYDPKDFPSIASGIRAIGTLCGTDKQAAAAADAMVSSIEKVKAALAQVPQDRRPTVFWEVYDEPLMTCGSTTFPHEIIRAAGGRDLFSDLANAWPQVSAEEVIRRAPDYIMGADDHGDKLTVAAVKGRPGWAAIPAVRDGRIVLINANIVSRAGPRVADGVLAVARALYPAIFR